MRKTIMAAALAAALVAGTGVPVRADPPDRPSPAAPGGWSRTGDVLAWRAPARVPMGDAAVEFLAGDRPLGRPTAAADGRTFRLRIDAGGRLDDLRVRAGGRRLDVITEPAGDRFAAAAPPAPLPPNPADPGVKGPHATVTGEYSLSGVRLPGLPRKVEMQAVVVAPKGTSGRRPLALFLHGRHSTCYRGSDPDGVTDSWPCAPGHRPIPSYRGYLQAQELLASQGYVTVSISANGINGQDDSADDGGAQARSSLVRLHLARWAGWAGAGRANAPAIVRAAPRAEMSKVFLMGHSRGGEGVSRAAMDSLAPPPATQDGYHGRVRWTIRGMLLIGPTVFGHNPVPDVPSATILPGCDRDVADLQGQAYIDGTRGVGAGRALHSALYVIGANHNFFNAEWTPGQSAAPSRDDFDAGDDPVCSAGRAARLTARQEQSTGATYIAAAARLIVGGDDRVRPLLDGSGVRARSADPARVLSHAIGAGRTPAILPAPGVRVTGGRICAQVGRAGMRSCLDRQRWTAGSPHFVPYRDVRPEAGRYALELAWSSAGTPVTVQPASPADLTGSRALALRLIVRPNTTGTRLGVAVVDPGGARTTLGDISLNGLPGSAGTRAWAQEVRVPLGGFRGRVARFEFTPRTAIGEAVLLDAWGWRPGTPQARAVPVPRLDLGEIRGFEGDAGVRVHQIPATVTGRGHGRVRLFLTSQAGGASEVTSWVATVRPGTRVIPVPVSVRGDTRFGWDREYTLDAKAVRNTLIGDDQGEFHVTDDDPAPVVTVTPVATTVAEGGTLTWSVRLSATADREIYVFGRVIAPARTPELSSIDVPARWYSDATFGGSPLPARPLSSACVGLYVLIPAGRVTGLLTVPTVPDAVAEPAEYVRLDATASGRSGLRTVGRFQGTATG
ncbi:hypothetical protein [Actinoplanes sp. NPDC049118]|uniref:hypothetical protein n=1 Tax=Actinoplanes sp. NPDC049118 TaxID=3155769 RepID=UPI0033D2AE4A